MAKGKVFAAGTLLTAGDINTYLNPDVPAEGDAYDTGWNTASLTSSFLVYGSGTDPKYRRIGMQVEVCGAVKPASSTVATAINGSANQIMFTLPTGFRPSGYARVYICQGTGENRWCLTINPNGTVNCARYGIEAVPDTGTWLPFAATFMVG